jgi:hypothetical protein
MTVVAPHHPLARLEHVTPQQIADAGIIAAPIDSLAWASVTLLMRPQGLKIRTSSWRHPRR